MNKWTNKSSLFLIYSMPTGLSRFCRTVTSHMSSCCWTEYGIVLTSTSHWWWCSAQHHNPSGDTAQLSQIVNPWSWSKPLLIFLFLSEIHGFLSEEECRVVVQLAQLKGLMESQTTASSQGQEESNQPLLSLSTQEVFSLLDLNQDGLLQKQEVKREK